MLELELIATQDCDIDVGASAISHAAAAGKLDLVNIQLNKAGTVLDRDTAKATIDGLIADYDGYADGVVTWSAATKSDDNKLEYQGTTTEFRPTGAVANNNIGSIAVYNTAKTKVYFVANIEGPGMPMRNTLDNIRVTLAWRPSSQSLCLIIS